MEELDLHEQASDMESLLDINTQLAENAEVEDDTPTSSEEKRKLLERTKIVKQQKSCSRISSL